MFARSAATQKKMRKAKYQAALLLPSTTYLQGHHLPLQLLNNLTKQRKINHWTQNFTAFSWKTLYEILIQGSVPQFSVTCVLNLRQMVLR